MKYKVTLNNRIYEVVVEKGEAIIEAEYEANLPQVTATTQAVSNTQAPAPVQQPQPTSTVGGNTFSSPLPGTIVAVKCEAGKTYKSGDVLFVVESMKMENDVTLDKDATIVSVCVTKGQQIQSGTVLCTIK